MKTDYYDYRIAEHWLSALFNADYSGLEDSEIKQFDAFMEGLPDNRISWSIGDDEEPHFTIDEISGLHANCYDAKLIVEVTE